MFTIKPYIDGRDEKFNTFFTEIYQMDTSTIEDGISSCKAVIDGEMEELSWGGEVSELQIKKNNSVLEYHGNFVAEIPTEEVLKMLKLYLSKLKDYEREQN